MRGFVGTTPYKPIGKQRKCPLILLDLALGWIGHSGSPGRCFQSYEILFPSQHGLIDQQVVALDRSPLDRPLIEQPGR
jgi:hypothetical protein